MNAFSGSMHSNGKRRKWFSLAAIFLIGSASAALAQESVPMGPGADISTMCGTKPTIVGLADGFGGGTWRKQVLAELKSEAAKCPNITKILYTDAGGDAQKANNDINSLVSQGVNVLISFPDFGPSQIPAYRAAMRAGVIVIPYNGDPGGKDGKDYTANVYQDTPENARIWIEWLGTHLKSGTLLYFGGPAGNASSAKVNDGIKAALEKYPDLKLLEDPWIATNWNPVDAQKAAIGAIAKYGQVDAIITDYGVVALQVIRAYEQAGLKIPYLAGMSGNNELSCKWAADKAAGKEWPYLTLEGTTTIVRNALRRGMAEYQGTKDDEPLGAYGFVFADTLNGIDPPCHEGAPLDADFSGMLSDKELAAVFGQ